MLNEVLQSPDSAEPYREAVHRLSGKRAPNDPLLAKLRSFLLIVGGFEAKDRVEYLRFQTFLFSPYYLSFFSYPEQHRAFSSDAEMKNLLARAIVADRRPMEDKWRGNALSLLADRPAEQLSPPLFILSSMSDSCGNYLADLLSRYSGRPISNPTSRGGSRLGDQFGHAELYQSLFSEKIVHSHFEANSKMLAAQKLSGVPVVVLVRNIFDSIVSCAIRSRGRDYAGSKIRTLAPEQIFDIVIGRMASFQVDLFASWQVAKQNHRVSFVRAEDYLKDPAGTVGAIFRLLGHEADKARLANVIKQLEQSELKKALLANSQDQEGIGKHHLNERQIAHVRSLYLEYPHVDFSAIDPDFKS